jgi:hypothetical protein
MGEEKEYEVVKTYLIQAYSEEEAKSKLEVLEALGKHWLVHTGTFTRPSPFPVMRRNDKPQEQVIFRRP